MNDCAPARMTARMRIAPFFSIISTVARGGDPSGRQHVVTQHFTTCATRSPTFDHSGSVIGATSIGRVSAATLCRNPNAASSASRRRNITLVGGIIASAGGQAGFV
jgi:hypothetical protein